MCAIAVERIEIFDVSCPSQVLSGAPHIVACSFNPAYVVGLNIVIPAGHVGLTGIALAQAGTRIIPHTAGAYIEGDAETISWELTNFLNTGQWTAELYNEDYNPHSWQLRFLLDELIPLPTGKLGLVVGGGGAVAALTAVAPGTPGLTATGEAEQHEGLEAEEEGAGVQEPTEEEEHLQEAPHGEGAPSEPAPSEPAPSEPPTTPPPAEAPLGEPTPPEAAPPEAPAPGEGEGAGAGEGALSAGAEEEAPGAPAAPASQASHESPPADWNVPDTLADHDHLDQGAAIVANVLMHAVPGLTVASTSRSSGAPDVPAGRHDTVQLHALPPGAASNALMARAAVFATQRLTPYLTEGIHNPGLSARDGRGYGHTSWPAVEWSKDKLYVLLAVSGAQRAAAIKKRADAASKSKPKGHPAPAKAKKPAGKPKPGPGVKGKPRLPAKARPAPITRRRVASVPHSATLTGRPSAHAPSRSAPASRSAPPPSPSPRPAPAPPRPASHPSAPVRRR